MLGHSDSLSFLQDTKTQRAQPLPQAWLIPPVTRTDDFFDPHRHPGLPAPACPEPVVHFFREVHGASPRKSWQSAPWNTGVAWKATPEPQNPRAINLSWRFSTCPPKPILSPNCATTFAR